MKRYLLPYVRQDLDKKESSKIILVSGPRQVGKTTLAQSIVKNFSYYNYDIKKDLKVFKDQEWDKSTSLVIFDELHKMKKWKLWLKGAYDNHEFDQQRVIVTGSARLSYIKKVGDSLAGRYFEYRLHPLDLKELKNTGTAAQNYKKLTERGGFPEPYLSMSLDESRRWRKTHIDVILRQDLISLEVIRNLDQIELLIEMLSTRVGSLVSLNSLAEDLQVSDATVKRWIGLLEDLYVIFRVSPYSKNIPRSLSKAGKYYFYDLAQVQGDAGVLFENMTALSLKKELDFIEDTKGLKTELNFIRNKEKKEIDFLILIQNKKPKLIEVKWAEDTPSSNFEAFEGFFKTTVEKIQLVGTLDRRFDSKSKIKVEPGLIWLENLNLI